MKDDLCQVSFLVSLVGDGEWSCSNSPGFYSRRVQLPIQYIYIGPTVRTQELLEGSSIYHIATWTPWDCS